MNKHLFGGFLITLSMAIFSMIGPFIRYINLPPLTIIFYSTLFTATILFVYFLSARKLRELFVGRQILWLFISSLCILGNTYTYFTAYKITTLANSVLTHYTAPIFAAMLAPLLLKEKLEKVTLVSLVFASIGLFLIASNGLAFNSQHMAGIIYGSLSGFFYGVLILISKKLVSILKPTVILFYQCTVTVIILSIFMDKPFFVINIHQGGMLILYALVISILGVTLYLKGLRHVEAQHAGILAYSEPTIVVIIGILFYAEIPTWNLLFGGLMIIYSGYLIFKAEAKRA
jgi:drug/metabolite transporter (DMT)-like permease